MKKLLIFSLIGISTFCYGQQTVQFADSIRKSYHIPEISYAVINSKSILEIAALGRHSINLPDTAILDDRFHLSAGVSTRRKRNELSSFPTRRVGYCAMG